RPRAVDARGRARAVLPAAALELSGVPRGTDGARHPAPGPVQRLPRLGLRAVHDRRRGHEESHVDLGPRPGGRRDAWNRRVLALAMLTAIGVVALLGQLSYLQAPEGGPLPEISEQTA